MNVRDLLDGVQRDAAFYATVNNRLATARGYMIAAQLLMQNGGDAGVVESLLDRAAAEQDAMVKEMRVMNARDGKGR